MGSWPLKESNYKFYWSSSGLSAKSFYTLDAIILNTWMMEDGMLSFVLALGRNRTWKCNVL